MVNKVKPVAHMTCPYVIACGGWHGGCVESGCVSIWACCTRSCHARCVCAQSITHTHHATHSAEMLFLPFDAHSVAY